MAYTSQNHPGQLVDAFENIEDKNALAWSVLDTKSESAIVRAIALSANRRARARVAHVEFPPRLDLVFVTPGAPTPADAEPQAAYEAKAAYSTDFQPSRIQRDDWYLGRCIDDGLTKLPGLELRYPTLSYRAALFFIYEVSDSARLLKYGGHPAVDMTDVDAALRKTVSLGEMSSVASIDCGTADGATVKIHMYAFTPRKRT